MRDSKTTVKAKINAFLFILRSAWRSVEQLGQTQQNICAN